MTIHLTCPKCGSGVHIYPSTSAKKAECDICSHSFDVNFSPSHEQGEIKDCPYCARKDFYIQKDFNRKIGIALFVIASILAIFTYGISFIVLYIADYFLFKKLKYIVICYNCKAIFRNTRNWKSIPEFNHEMNDRIVYAGQDFQGRPLDHH